MEVNMKKIPIDTNYNCLGPDKPVLSKQDIVYFKVEINERVIAAQEGDEWVGTVKFDSSLPEQWQWYIELDE